MSSVDFQMFDAYVIRSMSSHSFTSNSIILFTQNRPQAPLCQTEFNVQNKTKQWPYKQAKTTPRHGIYQAYCPQIRHLVCLHVGREYRSNVNLNEKLKETYKTI